MRITIKPSKKFEWDSRNRKKINDRSGTAFLPSVHSAENNDRVLTQVFLTSTAFNFIPQPSEIKKQQRLHSACKNLKDIYCRSLQFKNPAQYLSGVLFLQEKKPSP